MSNNTSDIIHEHIKQISTNIFEYINDNHKQYLILNDKAKQNIFPLKLIISSLAKLLEQVYLLAKSKAQNQIVQSFKNKEKENILLIMKMIKLISNVHPQMASDLTTFRFAQLVFNVMALYTQDKAFQKACIKVFECVLVLMDFNFDLSSIPTLQHCIGQLSGYNFTLFLRILSLCILDKNEIPSQFQFARSTYPFLAKMNSTLISNYTLVASQPAFLQSLCHQLSQIQLILQQLFSQVSREQLKGIMHSQFIHDIGFADIFFDIWSYNHYQFIEEIPQEERVQMIYNFVQRSNLAEVLFQLSNLQSGKRKKDMQCYIAFQYNDNRLIQTTVASLMNVLFDESFANEFSSECVCQDIDVQNRDLEEMIQQFQYNPMECVACDNPVNHARIQLLRLIVTFCDKDHPNFVETRSLLLSKAEIQTLEECWQSYSSIQYQNGNQIENQMGLVARIRPKLFTLTEMKMADCGIMALIVKNLIKLKRNSSIRYWLCSSVESFVRGAPNKFQFFAVAHNLIPFLVEEIYSVGAAKQSNIQIIYDLLAEVLKFNHVSVFELGKVFLDQKNVLPAFLDKIASNLVDSNVLLRSLLLYHEYNLQMGKQSESSYQLQCQNNSYINLIYNELYRKQQKWAGLLLQSIEPTCITQENICVLNSAMIILIFANCKGELNDYLRVLQNTNLNTSKVSLLDNLMGLIQKWNNYYESKSKDCFGLIFTSKINIAYFRRIMSLIASYYLQPKQSSIC